MGRAQSQTRGVGDLFSSVMPNRRGIKDEGLLAQAPTRYDRGRLGSLLDELRAGQPGPALRALQEHHGHDAPLLRELYDETLEEMLRQQEKRAHVASTYLMILGVQRNHEGEACMLDEPEDEDMAHLPPGQRGKATSLVHLRMEGKENPICYETDEEAPPSLKSHAVPYGLWLQARLQPGKEKRIPCATCEERVGLPRDLDEDGQLMRPDMGIPASLDAGVADDVRASTDAALRQLLGSQEFITPRTGYEVASRQYKRGACAGAVRTLRADQEAFEKLCFTPEQRKQVERLQAISDVPIRELLSEEQWLELLVSDFPSSTDEAITNGVKKHWYGDAALLMIGNTLSAQGKFLKSAA